MCRWATGCANSAKIPPMPHNTNVDLDRLPKAVGQTVVRVIAVPSQRRRRGQEPAKDGRRQLDHEQAQAEDDAQERRPVDSGRRRGGDEQHAQRVGTAVAEERACGRPVPDEEPETRARHGEAERRGGTGDGSNADEPKGAIAPRPGASPSWPSIMFTALQQATVASTSTVGPHAPSGSNVSPPATRHTPAADLHRQSHPRRQRAKVVPESARERDQHPERDPPSRVGSRAGQTAGERSDREGGPRVGHRSLVQLEGARPIDEPDPRSDADQRRRPDQRDGGGDQERQAATQT